MKWSNLVSREDRPESSTTGSGSGKETDIHEFYSYFSTNGRFTRKLFRQNLRVEGKVLDSETREKCSWKRRNE